MTYTAEISKNQDNQNKRSHKITPDTKERLCLAMIQKTRI